MGFIFNRCLVMKTCHFQSKSLPTTTRAKFDCRETHYSIGNDFPRVSKALGLLVPVPGVLERLDLRLAALALGRFEEEIVVALGVKRRVQIDEVHRFRRDVLAEDSEVVAVVKGVHAFAGVCGKARGLATRTEVLNSFPPCRIKSTSSPRPSPPFRMEERECGALGGTFALVRILRRRKVG